MTRDEWRTLAKHMKMFYKKSKDFLNTEEEVDAWFAFAMDMDFKQAKQAVKRIIEKSVYPPGIAEIKASYDELTKEHQDEKRQIKEIYKEMENYYPACLRDEDRLEAFYFALKSSKDGKPIECAKRIKKAVIQAVMDAEKSDTDNLPPLSECIRKCINGKH